MDNSSNTLSPERIQEIMGGPRSCASKTGKYEPMTCNSCGRVIPPVPEEERHAVGQDGIPLHPEIVYAETGEWKGWRDFLGSSTCCDECGGWPSD